MSITSISSVYIQKSRIFLYPLLGIRRGASIVPTDTYLQWENVYKLSDCKFITIYHLRDDKEFKEFEEKSLLNNPLFENFFEIEDNKGVYIFDFSKYKEDYFNIIKGKYSKLNDDYKLNILNFYKNRKKHHSVIQSYLFPERFFSIYAKLLNVKLNLIEKVGELCSLPDIQKESLKAESKIYKFENL